MIQASDQCPLAGGFPVLKARNLLWMLGAGKDWSGEVNCNPIDERGSKKPVDISNIRVYPNPANETVIFERIPAGAALQIFTSGGGLMFTSDLQQEGEHYTWHVNNIQEGVYYYHILQEGSAPLFGKIVIIH